MPPNQSNSGEITKLTVNLPSSTVEALKELAEKRGTTMTEVIKSAIGTEKYLTEKDESGSKVLVEDKDHTIKELVFSHRLR